MDRLTLLRAFVRIVDCGSLTAAAGELRVGQSTMSKWLAALEAEAGMPLVDRTTRSLRVTEAGATLLGHARQLVEGWEAAMAEVQAQAPRIEGRLRISVPAVFGVRHVVPHVGAFLDRHPDVRLNLLLADRYVSLLDEGFDVAIRVGLAVPSTLRARRLATSERVLVASPSYLEWRGAPSRPEDLEDHGCLVHTGVSGLVWTLTRGEEEVRASVSGRVTVNHSEALRQLAVQGHGVALLAHWLVRDDLAAGRLVALLPEWTAPPAPIRALLPPARQVPARVRAFLDHLVQEWEGQLPGV